VRLRRQCQYAAPEGVTRQQANKRRLAEVERMSSCLRDVVDLLRQGTEADAAVALGRIRQAERIDDAVQVLAAAQALVAPAYTAGTSTHSSTRPNEASGANPNLLSADERSRSSSCVSSQTLRVISSRNVGPKPPIVCRRGVTHRREINTMSTMQASICLLPTSHSRDGPHLARTTAS
jgi:hypothetical protein